MNQSIQDKRAVLGDTLRHNYKLLAVVTVIGILLGGAISYTATEKYSATAVVYAAGSESGNEMAMKQGNTLLLMQILRSSYLRDTVISVLNLSDHYGLTVNNARERSILYKRFDNNVSFERTIYKSVEITVSDEDPEMAVRIANRIIAMSSAVKNRIIQENKSERLAMLKNDFLKKRGEVDSLLEVYERQKELAIRDSTEGLQKRLGNCKSEINNLQKQRRQLEKKVSAANPPKLLAQLQQRAAVLRQELAGVEARMKLTGANTSDSLELRQASLKAQIENTAKRSADVDAVLYQYRDILEQITESQSRKDRLKYLLQQLQTGEITDFKNQIDRKKIIAEQHSLEELKRHYEKSKAAFEKPEVAAYTVSRAVPDFDPSYPPRLVWSILGGVLLLSAVLLFILFRKLLRPVE